MTETQELTRVDPVQLAADALDHIICTECWVEGMPMLCGEPDNGGPIHWNCSHDPCPICVEVWKTHWCTRPVKRYE